MATDADTLETETTAPRARPVRDEDAAQRQAFATLGYFAAFAWMGYIWGDPAELPALDDVVVLGLGLGALAGLARYFNRIGLRMIVTAATIILGIWLGWTGQITGS